MTAKWNLGTSWVYNFQTIVLQTKKNSEKLHTGNLSQQGIEPRPTAWQASAHATACSTAVDDINFSFFLLLLVFLPSPNLGLTPPGTNNPNARGSDAFRRNNCLWTRTLDRYTRAGLPECVVSTLSWPPPETTQDRTQTKDMHPNPGQKLKFLTSSGTEYEPPGWKAGTLPTTTNRYIFVTIIIIIINVSA